MVSRTLVKPQWLFIFAIALRLLGVETFGANNCPVVDPNSVCEKLRNTNICLIEVDPRTPSGKNILDHMSVPLAAAHAAPGGPRVAGQLVDRLGSIYLISVDAACNLLDLQTGDNQSPGGRPVGNVAAFSSAGIPAPPPVDPCPTNR